MNLPTFNEIHRVNIKYLSRPAKWSAAYPGFCSGSKETARRLKQIRAGKLEATPEYEDVKFETREG